MFYFIIIIILFCWEGGGVEKNCDCLAHHRPHVTASSHRATVSCSPSMCMNLRFGSPSFNAHTFTRCTTQPACTLSLYLFTLLTSNYYCSQVSPMLRRKQGPQDLAAWKKLKGYKYGENERIRPTKKVVVIWNSTQGPWLEHHALITELQTPSSQVVLHECFSLAWAQGM